MEARRPAIRAGAEIPISILNAYFLWGVVAYHLRDRGRSLRHLVPLVAPALLLIQYVSHDSDLNSPRVADRLRVHRMVYGKFDQMERGRHARAIWRRDLRNLSHPRPRAGHLRQPGAIRSTLISTASLVLFSGALALAVAAVFGTLEAALYRRLRQWITPAKKVHLRIYHESHRESGMTDQASLLRQVHCLIIFAA